MVCAAILRKKGFDVRILDGRVQSDWIDDLKTACLQSDWIILTSSPLDRWQCPNLEVEHFIQIARTLPSEKLIITGIHGTLYPEAMLDKTGARAVICGEPEIPLQNMLTQNNWPTIAGMIYRKDGQIISTGRTCPPDLSNFPPPAFDLIDFRQYRYELLGSRFALFEGSRGCPYDCSFCLKTMYADGIRYKRIQNLIKEVDLAVKQHGVCSGYFIDLEFNANRLRTIEFCDRLTALNLPFVWCCQTRADTVDDQLLFKMKQAGCRLIHFGIETGSARLLHNTNKKIALDSISNGIQRTHKAGLDTACFFLFGFPGETEQEMLQTIDFALQLNPTFASFHVVTPYPETDLYHRCFPSDHLCDHSLTFPYHCPQQDPFVLNQIIRKAYRRFVISRIKNGRLRSLLAQLRLFWEFNT